MKRCAFALAFAASAASAQQPQPVGSDSAFVRITAEYKKLGMKPSVDELVRLHKEIDDAVYAFEVGIAASYVRSPGKPLRLSADFADIGVFPHPADTSALLSTSKLLKEAHLADPNSKWRSLTLYALLSPDIPDAADPFALAASRDYLDEFPKSDEAKRVAVNLAHLYDDIYKVVRDSMKGPGKAMEYRVACFKPYLTKAPLAEQLTAAKDSAVRYYNKSLALLPQNPSLREQRLLINGDNNASWYFCNQ